MQELDFKLTGFDSALAALKQLPDEMQTKGVRFGMRKAANLVRDAAIANAKTVDDNKTEEDISKNIAVRFSSKAFKSNGDVVFRVGVLGGAATYADDKKNRRLGRAGKEYVTAGDKSNPGGNTWYWRFVEFGTSRSAAKPFMRPALEDNAGAAMQEAARQISKWVDRNIKRIAKGAK